ncbi:MAG: hypothetical protein NXI01_06420 [Gammaproteobacteria bacterium]|nr:hypothetical protein [Gammaproteobacteria bacterium]
MIIISKAEQSAIQDYFDHPERYMDAQNGAQFQNHSWPNGTKISRPKLFITENGESRFYRYYIIPINNEENICRIPIKTPHPDDPATDTHSATLQKNKLYFHQNKTDGPEYILSAKWDDFLDTSTKNTVKYAVDSETNLYYLKSKMASGDYENSVAPPNDVYIYARNLYMGPSLFRRSPYRYATQTKRVDITRDAGETLFDFIPRRKNDISESDVKKLAIEILKQYLVQISNKNRVHADIKPLNICVKETQDQEQPFIITFIDFEEAFDANKHSLTEHSTVKYMAPEFFKTIEDFENQEKNWDIFPQTYMNTLIPDYQKQFSLASDIFALGTTLKELPLPKESGLAALADAMRALHPEDRPSGTQLHLSLYSSQPSPSEVRRHSI